MVLGKKAPVEGFHSWVGSLIEPTNPVVSDGKLPNYHLEVNHVFGYNEQDVYYLNEKEVIFATGSVGVIQDINTRSQRLLIGHNNDITSLVLNKERTLAATGQVGLEVLVIIWDLVTLKAKYTIKVGKFQGISSLSFSPDGSKLVGTATDVHRTLFIWDLKNGPNSVAPLTSQFSFPIDHVLFNQNKTSLIVYGEKNINFLTVAKDQTNPNSLPTITKKTGLMGSLSKQPTILSCLALNSEYTAFGTREGHILIFHGVNIVKDITVGKASPIYDILRFNENSFIVVSENKVISYEFPLKEDVQSTEISTISSVSPVIPVSLDLLNDNLIIGTTSSDIYYLNLKEPSQQGYILRAHDDEVNNCWTITNDLFLTGSNDKSCQIWSISEKRQVLELPFKSAVTTVSATLNSSPIKLSIGLLDGSVVIYNFDTKKEEQVIKADSERIRILRFSPNNEILSIGLTNGNIQNYQLQDGTFKLISTCKGSSSHISFLDFSTDSNILQSNSGAYEILYWDVKSGSQIKSATQVKDVDWATWTCLLGYNVKGIWSKGQDGSDINCLSRSSSELSLLATGDDSNNVNLFKYPVSHENSHKKVYNGYHSSHVLSCTFTNDSKHLITVGGDKTIFVWNVKSD